MTKTRPKVLILENEQQIRCQLSLYFEGMDEFEVVEAGAPGKDSHSTREGSDHVRFNN